jgi:hypothetical protein
VKSLNPILILRRARWYTLASTEKRWDVTEKHADVMFELADAPDLGLRNDRLQNIARRFKTNTFHEGKTIFLAERACSPRASRMLVILAQLLAQGRARLCLI